MGKMRGCGRLTAIGWVAVLLLSGNAAHAQSLDDPAVADPAVVEAVWKPQRIDFVYRGYSTLYSCGGLQDKLEKILATVGARDHVELRAYSCDDALSIARFQIALASPVEATPENVQELTTYDARDELIARVRGERLARAEDLPRFPAVWKTISFARSREMRLEPGDCELVQELRRHVLPRMSVQIVSDRVRCSAFGNIGKPQLTVSALVPVE
ncbi:MAG TPA: hypothetical protein VFV69_07365 [Steroidobacteraceae bacterium]|jgi:hypothetical protein|nr:hypothetical protein [Steroidobacteraceae bacterium]